MAEYKLSYTASEIDKRLGKVSTNENDIKNIEKAFESSGGDTISIPNYLSGTKTIYGSYIKISDTPISMAELQNGGSYVITYIDKGTERNMSFKNTGVQNYLGNANMLQFGAFISVIADITLSGETVSAGLYADAFSYTSNTYASSLTINGYSGFATTKLKESYLPESSLVVVQNNTPSKGAIWIDTDASEEILIAEIDDDTIDPEKTWSSKKIDEEVSELNERIDNITVVDDAVKFTSQSLTDIQKEVARENIDTMSTDTIKTDIGNTLLGTIISQDCCSLGLYNFLKIMYKDYDGLIYNEVGFVHVSDKIPTYNDVLNGFSISLIDAKSFDSFLQDGFLVGLPLMNCAIPGSEVESMITSSEDGFILSQFFCVVPYDNYYFEYDNIGFLKFEKKGTYLIGAEGIFSLQINGFSFNDNKFEELSDKPFGEITKTKISADYSVVWDGNTNETISSFGALYLVSEEIIEYDKLKNSIATIEILFNNGFVGIEEVDCSKMVLFADNSYMIHETVFIVYADTTIGDIQLKKGLYLMHNDKRGYVKSFSINKKTETTTTIKKLDNKYLDVIESVDSDTLTWDGNTEGLESVDIFGDGEMYYLVNEAIPTNEEMSNGITFVIGSETHQLVAEEMVGNFYGLTPSGTEMYLVFVATVDNLTIGDTVISKKGIYICAYGDSVSLTIPGYTGFQTEKIKESYLPEHNHDISWNDVKDKPFETVGSDTLTWDGNTDGLEGIYFDVDGESVLGMVRVTDATFTKEDFANGGIIRLATETGVESEYTFISNNIFWTTDTVAIFAIYDDNDNPVFSGWISTQDNQNVDGIIVNTGMYVNASASTTEDSHLLRLVSITINGYTGFQTEKIKEKCLPEHTHSWNDLNDKPFYDEEIHMEEKTFTSEDMDGMYGCELIYDEVIIAVGDTVITTFDGVEYAHTVDTFNGNMFFGNLDLLFGLEGDGSPFVSTIAENTIYVMCLLDTEPTEHIVSFKIDHVIKLPDKYYNVVGIKTPEGGELFNEASSASGQYSHAEGWGTIASGMYSHAEGYITTASEQMCHAEGSNTTASGYYSHSEGTRTTASGQASHAEGMLCTASNSFSHAEGYNVTASGHNSHAEGVGTIAAGAYQHVQGKYNIEDTTDTYAHIIGNGGIETSRSNAHTLDWDGNAWFAGTIEGTALIINSSTSGSTKKFKVTVDDTGTLSAVEI